MTHLPGSMQNQLVVPAPQPGPVRLDRTTEGSPLATRIPCILRCGSFHGTVGFVQGHLFLVRIQSLTTGPEG